MGVALVAGRGVGNVAVSLARPRRRPASAATASGPAALRPAVAPASTSARLVLPDRTRIPRRPTRWAAATSARGSSPTIAKADRGQPLAEVRGQPGDRLAEDDRRRLAERLRPTARSRTRARRRTPPASSVSPLRRQPPRIAMHREQLGAAADQPERDVHVPVRQVVAGVADDDRRDRPGAAGVGLVGGRRSRWPSNSRRASVGGEHEQRPPRVTAPRCRRPWPRSPVMIRSGSIGSPPFANQPASVSRWSCEKFVTTRNGMPRSSSAAHRLDRPRGAACPGGRGRRRHRGRSRARRAAPPGAAVRRVIGRW